MRRTSLLTSVFSLSLVLLPAIAAADDSVLLTAGPIRHAAGDWPQWRGPEGNGIAEADQAPPSNWSSTENVVWKAKIPGRGHSSPIVVGDQVIVATADEKQEIQSVLSFDRKSGAEHWRADVHQGGMDRKGNQKTTQASATAACDGQRLLVNFLNRGAIYTTALSLDGKQLWQTKVSDFATHQGFGSSPVLHGPLVYVTTDSRGGGVVAALDRVNGKVVWRQDRPSKANYASATLLTAAGRAQLVVHGCDLVSSFDPTTGRKLWEIEGATTECVTSLTTDGQRVFVSGGYPRQHVQAVEADGSGKTAWENTSQVYVPSMIVKEGVLYAVLDTGVATCWKCDTGEQLWKERLGGTFTASLVLVGENLYAVNEAGQCFIFKASPEKFELVAENKLGDEVYATPAICGSRIYMRVVERTGGQRQEMLYCLGSK
ncbi:MAG TPA: PQQ-binding-like beta-propeller repeat protein [Pirellulaceae bacterium]|nr:PQQ-binding-like beta-propeller repeat protein [Pirellulaceae bacterium]